MHIETNRQKSFPARRFVVAVFTIVFLLVASWVTSESLRAADESQKATTEKTDTTKVASDKASTAAANPDEKTEPREETPYPQLIEATPAAGSTDIDPKLTEIRVTFDRDMSEGMSWTGGGDTFPKLPDGAKAKWSKDGRTCTLPVKLEPDHEYKLGLNSLSHNNFQSKWGVPLKPMLYTFRTASEAK